MAQPSSSWFAGTCVGVGVSVGVLLAVGVGATTSMANGSDVNTTN
jgi:hypothetical protein